MAIINQDNEGTLPKEIRIDIGDEIGSKNKIHSEVRFISRGLC
jgi:hypothetical protein